MNKQVIFILILLFLISMSSVYAENDTDINSIDDFQLKTSDAVITEDNSSFDASLKYLNETPCSNQSLTFTVNNVNYTRITSNDGIASININLPAGIYPICTTFTGTDNQKLINNNMIYVCDSSATIISDDMDNNEIQSIFDSANFNETIIFTGDKYENIALNISKNPLNIMGIIKTTLTGNGIDSIFTVESSGTRISNFILKKGKEAVYIKNADNISIEDNIITDNINGIVLENSKNTNIFNNSISNSLENAIFLKNTFNINISANTFVNNYDAVYFDDNAEYTNIEYNNITKSRNYGIDLNKSGDTSSIRYNTISNNENGINIDCAGDANLFIEFNTISSNFENGIYIGANYRKSGENSILSVSNNSIIYNSNFNILGKASIYNSIPMGDNWIASNDPTQNRVCEKIRFRKITMGVEQTDANTLSLTVDGIVTPFDLRVSYNGGRNWQNVNFVNGHATIHVSNDDGNVIMQYYEGKTEYRYQLADYVAYSEPAVPDTPSQDVPSRSVPDRLPPQDTPVQPEYKDTSSKGNGTGYYSNFKESTISNQAISSGNSPLSESSAGTVSSSSQYETPQNSQTCDADVASGESQSVVKSINIDEDDIIRVSGIGMLLLIIMAIVGFYYMDDIKYMLNQKNGE